VLPDPFRGIGAREEFREDPTVGHAPKVWIRYQNRSSAKDAQVHNNPEGD